MSVPFTFAFAADGHGCFWHRVGQPAMWLQKNGIALSNACLGNIALDQLIAAQPDCVILQRQIDIKQIEMIRQLKSKLPQTKWVFELDDRLTDVPAESIHEPFQPYHEDVREHIALALAECDWAVVPTQPLADWLKDISPNTTIKIMPNLLEELDSKDLPRILARETDTKPIYVWGGGISHAGDLRQIVPAVCEITGITWKFLGMKPEGLEDVDIEFIPGVPPQQYHATLFATGAELVLAPLEPNSFNEAKSNLRLLQAGAMGAAVIASPVFPYTDKSPPVFKYASTPEEWTAALKEWGELPEKTKLFWRSKMRNWARDVGSVQRHLAAVADAWGVPLPAKKVVSKVSQNIIAVGQKDTTWLPTDRAVEWASSLEEGAQRAVETGAPLLWVRQGTIIPEGTLDRLVQSLRQRSASSVCCLSNDGLSGFDFLSSPQQAQLCPTDTSLEKACIEAAENSGLEPRQVLFPLGPVVLFSPEALAKVQLKGDHYWDWGQLMTAAGGKHLLVPTAWATATEIERVPEQAWAALRGLDPGKVKPALTSEERIKLECRAIRHHSLVPSPSTVQDMGAWSSIFVPEQREVVSVVVLEQGDNAGLKEAKAAGVRWIRWNVDGVEVQPGADGIMEATGEGTESCSVVVYADAMGPMGVPAFRPASFDREWFLSWDYVSGCCLICTAAWDWDAPKSRGDLFRRLIELAREGARFDHCPHILYTEQSAANDDVRAAAINDLLPNYRAKTGLQGLLEVHKVPTELPKVSIIMLTSGNTWILRPGLSTLLRRTRYPDFEVLLGRAGPIKGDPSRLPECHEPNVSVIELGEGEFNWSAHNNALANMASGEVLVFLNDDCRIISEDWLKEMVAYATEPDVGCVGLRLLQPADGAIQHVGVYCDSGLTGHIHKGFSGAHPGYWGYAKLNHEATAVTGACLAVETKKFTGFNENLRMNFADVALGLEMTRAKLRNIVVATSEMQHAESSSRPAGNTPEGIKLLRAEQAILAKNYPEPDKYWNKSLRITVHPSKLGATGFNFDLLNWEKAELDGAVLMLNYKDGDVICREAQNGHKVIMGIAEHGRFMPIRPGLANAGALELRERTLIRQVLADLGVKEVRIAPESVTPEAEFVRQCLSG